jgi:hypothetical protein
LNRSNAEGDGATQLSSKEEGCFIESSRDPTETSPCSVELPGQADLASSLQSLHESARDMLLITNEVSQFHYTMHDGRVIANAAQSTYCTDSTRKGRLSTNS